MFDVTKSSGTRVQSLALCLVLAAATLALAISYLKAPQGWGDDDAGYILQARALAAGTALEELALNGKLLRASDRQVGPDAYPWGYPLFLAATARVAGWSEAAFRMATVGFLLVTLIATWVIGRQLGLRPIAAAAIAALVCWQPDMLNTAASVASDVPFLAVSMLSLSLAVAMFRYAPVDRRRSMLFAFASAVAAVASVAVRSNGIVTIIAVGMTLLLCPSRLEPGRMMKEFALYAGTAAIGIGLNYAAFPDGSQAYMGYLSLSPGDMTEHFMTLLSSFGALTPILVLPKPLEIVATISLLIVAGFGVFALRSLGALLGLVVLGHLALLTLVTFAGRTSYLYPVLPALGILVVHGASVIQKRLPIRQWDILWLAPVVLVGAAAVAYKDRNGFHPSVRPGPTDTETSAMFDFVAQHTQPEDVVAFFKPRAMRLHTGRPTIVATSPSTLAIAQAAVLHAGAGELNQLTADAVMKLPEFTLAYRNQHYLVFLRTAG
jgi:hypothetical protein